jgi:toxin ParE1/3/4
MKKYTVAYSNGGLRDIADLTELTSARFIESLIDTCDSLQLFPYRGTKRPELRPNMRIIGHRRAAAIVFRIEEVPRLVLILGVTYRGQSLEKVLARDE